MGSSFISKIKYKKELVGFVKKDGKTYAKYVKARRFRLSSNLKYAVLGVFVMVVLGLGIKFMIAVDAGEIIPSSGRFVVPQLAPATPV